MYPNGFPLTLVGVRWMNPYYYYGMCNSSDYLNLQESIKNLINNDSKGLYCPKNIPSKEIYVTNHELEKLFNAPA